MLRLMTDFIRAGVGWYEMSRRDRQISREQAHEDRMAPLFAAAAANPLMFIDLLGSIRREDVGELHRRLDARVRYFGTCFSRDDVEILDTMRWARDEVSRLHHPETGRTADRDYHDGKT